MFYMQDIMNAPFAEQALNNLRNYVGVSLSIPIFNRLTVWTGVRTSKLQMQQQELQLEEAKKTMICRIAPVAAVTYGHVNDKYFLSHYLCPFSTQPLNFKPEA